MVAVRKKVGKEVQDIPVTTKYVVILSCLALFSLLTLLMFRFVPTPQAHLEIDSSGYERSATHFEQTSELLDPATPTCHPVQTLAYPLFLGLIYKIFGHSYGWVVAVQLLLALLCGLLIFNTAQLMMGTKTALIALALWSINLGFLIYVQFLLTDLLLTTFLVAFLNRFITFLYTRNLITLLAAGLLLGCSVVVKPAGLFFVIPLTLFLLIFLSGTFAQRAYRAFLFAVLFALPVLGYMTRNKIQFGHFAIAPMAHEILYRYFAAKVKANIEGKRYEDVLENEQWCTEKDLLQDQGWQRSKEFLHTALKHHPLVFVRLWMTNVIKTWLGLFTTQWKVLFDPSVKGGDCSFFKVPGTSLFSRAYHYITYGQLPWLSVLGLFETLWTLLRFFLVALALFTLLQQKNYTLLMVCTSYLWYFTLVTGHDGCCRYRMMIEPLLIMLVAFGIDTCIKICGMLRKSSARNATKN